MIWIAIIVFAICLAAAGVGYYAFRDSNKILKQAEGECECVDWGKV